MKKQDFKKLAILGIVGGSALASEGTLQAQEQNLNTSFDHSLAASCGGGRGGRQSCSANRNSCSSARNSCSATRNNGYIAENDATAVSQYGVSEREFTSNLSSQGKADYDKLSTEGKFNARKMASHDCSGKNDCKGQNACKTAKNTCAGQGGCKGQSKCAMKPDQAVKVASMKDKRAQINSPNY